jgi:hypothetical protein
MLLGQLIPSIDMQSQPVVVLRSYHRQLIALSATAKGFPVYTALHSVAVFIPTLPGNSNQVPSSLDPPGTVLTAICGESFAIHEAQSSSWKPVDFIAEATARIRKSKGIITI